MTKQQAAQWQRDLKEFIEQRNWARPDVEYAIKQRGMRRKETNNGICVL